MPIPIPDSGFKNAEFYHPLNLICDTYLFFVKIFIWCKSKSLVTLNNI